MTRALPLLIALLLMLPIALHAADEEGSLQVLLEGIDGELASNARALLSIQQASEGQLPLPARIRFLHGRAASEIRLALEPFGHYRPVIDAELTREGTQWVARYRVDAGDRIPLRDVDLQLAGEAADDPAFAALRAAFPLATGEPLDHGRYEAAKGRLLALSAERGYFDARLTRSEIRVSMEAYTADVVLHLDSGPRYRFGPVSFDKVALGEELLRRFVRIREGQPFSTTRLLELQQDLINSDHFASVQVEPRRDATVERAVPIHVRLELRKRSLYTAGIGFGTDTGPRGRLGLERRRVNRRGHHFESELIASAIGSEVAFQYTLPWIRPQSDTLTLHATAAEEHSDVQDRRTSAIGASLQHVLGRWQRTWDLELHRESFAFGDAETTSVLLMPGLQLNRVIADNRFDTRRGSSLSFRLRGASRDMLSDLSFFQAWASAKWIAPLGSRSRLLARAELGTTWTDEFDALPSSLRFFTGGDRTVRGYGLDTIAPLNDDGDPIGGRNLAVASIELDRRILENWSVALFVDSGDAFDDQKPVPRTGAGIGLRWHSPIGPVRIDLASGLDEPGDPIRLHLTLGPDF